MIRRLTLLGLGALLLAPTPPPSASRAISGRYGPLALAIAADGSVHGVLVEQRIGNVTMEAPRFGCLFLSQGRMEGDEARVDTWFPGEAERIGGELRRRSRIPQPGSSADAGSSFCAASIHSRKTANAGLARLRAG